GIGGVVGHLHATGLAAPTGLHLRLDDHAAGQLLGGRAYFLHGVCDDAAWHRDAVVGEESLRLMFEQVHEGPSLLLRLNVRRPGPPRTCRAYPPVKPSPRLDPDWSPGQRLCLDVTV